MINGNMDTSFDFVVNQTIKSNGVFLPPFRRVPSVAMTNHTSGLMTTSPPSKINTIRSDHARKNLSLAPLESEATKEGDGATQQNHILYQSTRTVILDAIQQCSARISKCIAQQSAEDCVYQPIPLDEAIRLRDSASQFVENQTDPHLKLAMSIAYGIVQEPRNSILDTFVPAARDFIGVLSKIIDAGAIHVEYHNVLPRLWYYLPEDISNDSGNSSKLSYQRKKAWLLLDRLPLPDVDDPAPIVQQFLCPTPGWAVRDVEGKRSTIALKEEEKFGIWALENLLPGQECHFYCEDCPNRQQLATDIGRFLYWALERGFEDRPSMFHQLRFRYFLNPVQYNDIANLVRARFLYSGKYLNGNVGIPKAIDDSRRCSSGCSPTSSCSTSLFGTISTSTTAITSPFTDKFDINNATFPSEDNESAWWDEHVHDIAGAHAMK